MAKKSAEKRLRSYCSQCFVPTCDFRGPCRFPHGCCYSMLAILSAVGGLMMNMYVLGSCFFMRVQQVNPVTLDPIPGSERGYGFLSREVDYGITPDYKNCIYYPEAEYDNVFDAWTHVGRLFAFFSAMMASVAFLILLMTCCCAFSPSMFERWLLWLYILAAIFIALSMFAYGSEWCADNVCRAADGTGWAISAFMFHLVSANTVKSFASAGARRNDDEDEDAHDEELDDMYYEREEDKYPPHHPDGPRGIIVHKNGAREYDSGEDYFDDLGRMFDPYDERGTYRRAKQANRDDFSSDGLLSADLDDISDHDLDQYASDNDEDDDEDGTSKNLLRNAQPVFDPSGAANGNVGVGYDDQGAGNYQVDEYGNPVDAYGNPLPTDEFGNPVNLDEFGNPIPSAPVDEYGNPFPEGPVDEFGNPLPNGPVDEYGNPLPEFDEYGNPIPYEDGDYLHTLNEEEGEEGYDANGNSLENLNYDYQGNGNPPNNPTFA